MMSNQEAGTSFYEIRLVVKQSVDPLLYARLDQVGVRDRAALVRKLASFGCCFEDREIRAMLCGQVPVSSAVAAAPPAEAAEKPAKAADEASVMSPEIKSLAKGLLQGHS